MSEVAQNENAVFKLLSSLILLVSCGNLAAAVAGGSPS